MNKHVVEKISQISGWLTVHEGQFLQRAAESVKNIDGAVVEIGSFMGKSTIWLAHGGSHVFAVDPHVGEFSGGKTKPTLSGFRKNLADAGVTKSVTAVVKTSRHAADEWKKPVKFLFIDGLHDYAHALEDFTLWSTFLVDGGIIAMHDAFCGWDGAVEVALRHIVYSSDFGEIGVVGSIIYGVKEPLSVWKRIRKLFNQVIIELSDAIYGASFVPKWIKFVLVHRFLRIFLVNRFTSW